MNLEKIIKACDNKRICYFALDAMRAAECFLALSVTLMFYVKAPDTNTRRIIRALESVLVLRPSYRRREIKFNYFSRALAKF